MAVLAGVEVSGIGVGRTGVDLETVDVRDDVGKTVEYGVNVESDIPLMQPVKGSKMINNIIMSFFINTKLKLSNLTEYSATL